MQSLGWGSESYLSLTVLGLAKTRVTRNRLASIEDAVSVEGYEQARASPKTASSPCGFTRHPRHESACRRREGCAKSSPVAPFSHIQVGINWSRGWKARSEIFAQPFMSGFIPAFVSW